MPRKNAAALPLSLLLLLTSLAGLPTAAEAEGPPRLQPKSPLPVDFTYLEEHSAQDIYQTLGKAYGVTVLFAPDFVDGKVKMELPEAGAEEALAVLGQISGTFHKVLDATTILVANDTPQNRREHDDVVLRTFLLENADIKAIVTSLRSLVDSKRIATNENQGTLTVRDTADRMAVATRLVEILDRHPAEAQVDVTVLAVPRTLLQGLKSESEGVRLSREDFEGLRAAGEVTVLADPSVSILADGRGRLSLTDAVPVRVPLEDRGGADDQRYSYVDVGLDLRLDARVHAESRDVSLEVRLDLESLVPAPQGGLPTKSRRGVNTSLRLAEGQSYLVTGLMDVSPGSPGLFGGEGTRKGQQVVVAFTPRIIREPGLTEADLEGLWVGTESRMQAPQGLDENAIRFAGNPADREEIRQRLRARLAQLPRGLQADEEEAPVLGEGVELKPVESAPPEG
jgi:general secretion pathway protein D